jgi:hypothetical protein
MDIKVSPMGDLEKGAVANKAHKNKLPPPPTEYKRANRIWWGKSKVGRAAGTLWVVVPLIVLVEVAISLPLGTVSPDHPPRMAYYCTCCSLDSGDTLVGIAEDLESCIVDNILLMVGEMFQGFTINYLATMIGHIMVTYALMASQDTTVSILPGGRREMLHRAAYILLIIDMIIEIIMLEQAESADPSTLTLDGYTECGTESETEVEELKTYLVGVAWWVLVIRTIFGGLIAIIYVYKAPVEDFDVDSDSDDSGDEHSGGRSPRSPRSPRSSRSSKGRKAKPEVYSDD